MRRSTAPTPRTASSTSRRSAVAASPTTTSRSARAIGVRPVVDSRNWVALNHGTRDQFDSNGAIKLQANGNPVVNTQRLRRHAVSRAAVRTRFRNQLQTYLGNNGYYNNDVQVGLRRGNTNFNSSFSSDHNGGILPFKRRPVQAERPLQRRPGRERQARRLGQLHLRPAAERLSAGQQQRAGSSCSRRRRWSTSRIRRTDQRHDVVLPGAAEVLGRRTRARTRCTSWRTSRSTLRRERISARWPRTIARPIGSASTRNYGTDRLNQQQSDVPLARLPEPHRRHADERLS